LLTPGDGIKLAITTNNPPPARLLDVTRLISRAGSMPTGVDRVELAYLRHLKAQPVPLFAIARTTLGYVLLGGHGLIEIAARLTGAVPWGPPDRLSKLARRKTAAVRQAESDLRRFALDRCFPRRLGDMLTRNIPEGASYLNTGHSNLSERMLWTLRHRTKSRITVLIHDLIPLDFPHFQRHGTPEKFRAMLRRVQARADLIICNSQDTQARVTDHMQGLGDVPQTIVAHLGVEVPEPETQPMRPRPHGPYFVVLGTIEPRKGHDLLLDVWDTMERETGRDTPGLLIIGRRGWNNKPVFDRLDARPRGGVVQELPGLSDGTVAALLAESCGLLFPSHAEGFGLPPIEAAAMGVPVVCSDLPVIREVLRDIPVYASTTDRYQWEQAIKSLLKGCGNDEIPAVEHSFTPPTWDDHFNTVLRFA
jgi:glycosyltransferase involved in cell wall biosynthesis